MRIKFISEYIVLVCLLLAGCDGGSRENSAVLVSRTPFNYNTPNIHVFSVKATTAAHSLLYSDTLGFMCTNRADHINSGFTQTSWLFLSTIGNDRYVLNPDKYSNTTDGTLCCKDTLFMHPPRNDQYRILEICPYPFLCFPLYIGKKWNWDLDVGSMWCPSKGLSWSGVETFSMKLPIRHVCDFPRGKPLVIAYVLQIIPDSGRHPPSSTTVSGMVL